ncbi:MAG: NAD(P)/FAD-dependent oxidoreductase [Clostridiales bacterium]|jgi:predicted Rossmann fold flavoprotein|nr:NAD(P)/FAD-dependent oxidoreductase [Clostridiales bacterium]
MRIAVLGGGPAGVFAAGTASESKNNSVVLFEKNEKILKKLFISGKGRCNITNACSEAEFISNVVNGGRFLFSALKAFSPSETVRFFEERGLKLKTERGGRVFPASDKSSDVIKTLERFLRERGVELRAGGAVLSIKKHGNGFLVKYTGGEECFDAVVIATGGKSYPRTGSDGDGYRYAESFGHTIVEPHPALCAVRVGQNVKALEGLSLKNVSAAVCLDGKTLFSEFGEMLFTSDGLSGPIILSLSSRINRWDLKRTSIKLDLKPALSEETLDNRVIRDFKENINRDFLNSLNDLLPKSLVPYVIDAVKIPPRTKVNELSRENRRRLVYTLKNLTFDSLELAPLDTAIVTSGGVALNEINPKTMESKLVKNLYFSGEVLDIDALTGGFNIQAALSTGYVAGQALRESSETDC